MGVRMPEKGSRRFSAIMRSLPPGKIATASIGCKGSDIDLLDGRPCFLGIDSGSTTTKLLLMDDESRVALTWYAPNGGDPIGAVRKGLDAFRETCRKAGVIAPHPPDGRDGIRRGSHPGGIRPG